VNWSGGANQRVAICRAYGTLSPSAIGMTTGALDSTTFYEVMGLIPKIMMRDLLTNSSALSQDQADMVQRICST